MINDKWLAVRKALQSREPDKTLELLSAGGFDVNASSEDKKHTLLAIAVNSVSPLSVLKMLIELGADPTGQSSWQVDDLPAAVPLIEAAHRNREMTEFLLNSGALIGEMDNRNRFPLYQASTAGNDDVVELLLARGADVHQMGRRGTAFHAAATAGRLKIVQMLLQHGANPCASPPSRRNSIQALTRDLRENLVHLNGQDRELRKMFKDYPKVLEILAGFEGFADEDREAARALLAEVEAANKQALEAFKTLVEPETMQKRSWFTQVKKQIGNTEGDRTALEALAQHVLASPAVVAHKRWPDLLTTFIKQSRTYADVSEEVYGEAVAYEDDDEGPLRDAWENGAYVSLDLVFDPMLSAPDALSRTDWSKLMQNALKACDTYDFIPEDAIRTALTAGQNHSDYAEVLTQVKDLAERRDFDVDDLSP